MIAGSFPKGKKQATQHISIQLGLKFVAIFKHKNCYAAFKYINVNTLTYKQTLNITKKLSSKISIITQH